MVIFLTGGPKNLQYSVYQGRPWLFLIFFNKIYFIKKKDNKTKKKAQYH